MCYDETMSSLALDSPAARRYSEAVDRYAAVIRGRNDRPRGLLLRDVEAALAALYHAASELPEIPPDSSDVPEARAEQDQYRAIQGSLAALLGRYDSYREIFDPSDPDDREPVQALLSLDLVEVLEDVESGRSLLEPDRRVTPNDVLWQWRFDFTSHWGRHAVTALKVINSLLHTQFVDALDDSRPDA